MSSESDTDGHTDGAECVGSADHTDHADPDDGTPTTGWRVLAGTPTVVEIVDTLLDLPARREFNKSELAELAGVSRRSAQSHTETLVQAGVLVAVPETTPQRYRVDEESDVVEHLWELDAAVARNGPVDD